MKNTLRTLGLAGLIGATALLAGCEKNNTESEVKTTESPQNGYRTWTESDIANGVVPINVPTEISAFYFDMRFIQDFDKDGIADAITDYITSSSSRSGSTVLFVADGYQNLARERGFNVSPETKVMSSTFREKVTKVLSANQDFARYSLGIGERYFPSQHNVTNKVE